MIWLYALDDSPVEFLNLAYIVFKPSVPLKRNDVGLVYVCQVELEKSEDSLKMYSVMVPEALKPTEMVLFDVVVAPLFIVILVNVGATSTAGAV